MSKENTIIRSPLVDVAMSYISEINSEIMETPNNHVVEELRLAFDGYINKMRPRKEIVELLMKTIDTISPLERIESILKLGDIPAPPPPPTVALYDASGNDSEGKNRKKTRSWTTEEDMRLLMGVHLYGLENWTLVSQFVGNGRTRSMCSQRWIRVLDPRISKNHWTEEEDQNLLQMVKLYGEKSWMKIATKLGNRSDVQCRYHYQQLQRAGTVVTTSSTTTTTVSSPSSSSGATAVSPMNVSQAEIVTSPELDLSSYDAKQQFFPIPTTSPSSSSGNLYQIPNVVMKDTAPKTDILQFDLPPLTEHELQLRLNEPFGFDDNFDFFKSDPIYDNSFWACMNF
ncbi:Myb-like DNA-binding domain containing protein [Tritrichomonas foetus]|uniref:Myb-like DNA-binding domain containing protein n=1 Tax=Tritrichomonas foetus TaxID=1144522 RepID=A0A1J4KTC6_9EUKA|nr:Myb-like DNA-binding domain containing protein [Tritrichomonas foetus]|eukprot:OHT14537.1 Myb-like DNA-binding domain containing protein [Tritrichomonas foetus]